MPQTLANPPTDYEYADADFQLLHPHEVLVDPVRPRGMLGEIEVIEDDEGYAAKTSMFLRVLQVGPNCQVRLGAVYVCPVYCWDDFPFEGETYHVTDERNLKVEVEGYDEWSTD